MNKAELIKEVASRVDGTQKDAAKYVTAFQEAVTDAMIAGDEVRITGFGSFSVTERAAHIGRNPQTGEQIDVPASRVPKFKASSALKAAVNE